MEPNLGKGRPKQPRAVSIKDTPIWSTVSSDHREHNTTHVASGGNGLATSR